MKKPNKSKLIESYTLTSLEPLPLPVVSEAPGFLAPTVEREINRVWDPKKRTRLRALAIKNGYSFREAVQERKKIQIQLKQPPFDPSDSSLLPGVPSCLKCPKRLGNRIKNTDQKVIRTDICTMPSCFKRKEEAARELQRSGLIQSRL